ncbi:MAG: trehalose synthase [Bacteroidia bacterium]|nr:trehalose synthase [Bacteroidia bacterium]
MKKYPPIFDHFVGSSELRAYLSNARWFGGKGYIIEQLLVDEVFPVLSEPGLNFYLFLIEVRYQGQSIEFYQWPVVVSTRNETSGVLFKHETSFLLEAIPFESFRRWIFEQLVNGKSQPLYNGKWSFENSSTFNLNEKYLSSEIQSFDQSNTSIVFNKKYFFKLYRKLYREENPELELIRFLTNQGKFNHIPNYVAGWKWERKGIPPISNGLMMTKVAAEKDSWASTGDSLNDFMFSFLDHEFTIKESVFEAIELLGKRTAEMHLSLDTPTREKAFKHQKYDNLYRKWLHQHLTHLVESRLNMLDSKINQLDLESQALAKRFIRKKPVILRFFNQIKTNKLKSLRIRIHGDYHLGQVLFTGSDFIIIDFEGEPESSIVERKIKHSPLKDVAGMVRSFHYAVCAKLYFSKETQGLDIIRLQKSSNRWYQLIRDTFQASYFETIGRENPLFASKQEINFLLLLHLLEKAIYELGYELNGRPDWVYIPLKGINEAISELEKYLD